MPLFLVICLAFVQGLTEFLPVSSSGHLVVTRALLEPIYGSINSPLAFDIVVHLATAIVTAAFLHKEIALILRSVFTTEGQRARYFVLILGIATLPAVLVGLFAKDSIENLFRSPTWALNGFLCTALLLELAHRKQLRLGISKESVSTLDWQLPTPASAALIGVAQALAIMPGVSRSGSTIAAALLLGLPARSAVYFSFFMLLPVVGGAMLLESKHLSAIPLTEVQGLVLGFVVTMAVAYFALRFLVWVVERAKLRWFALYTACLGVFLRLIL